MYRMSEPTTLVLHIPEGINFECTGCGNCCFEWPVPITPSDFKSISKYAGDENLDLSKMFRVLKVEDEKLKVFSHSLEKRAADGKCEFLTADNRCRLHSQYGAQAKPSMCQLFPYTFTSTPSGTYVSLSFASSGVLFNQGKPLSEQVPLLEERHQLFRDLFPNLDLGWGGIQLIDGTPLSWDDYLTVEADLLKPLSRKGEGRADRLLYEQAGLFRGLLPTGIKLDNIAGLTSKPKIIDQVLVKHLLSLYFPADAYHSGVCELDAQDVAREFLAEPQKVTISHDGKNALVSDLVRFNLGRLPEPVDDLFRRFAYCRVFAKLYFGPGFNYFSIIAGLHHLAVLVALLRIRLKLELMTQGLKTFPDADECLLVAAEDLRTLERRLTVAAFSQEAMAMLEILLLSPQRVERILSLAA